MYERKSRRMRVQAVVMIAVLTLGLVGTAAIAQAGTVTDPTWGTLRVWIEIRSTCGVWRTASDIADIYHNEEARLWVEGWSNGFANDDVLLAFKGQEGTPFTPCDFFRQYGLQVTAKTWSAGDTLVWKLGGFPIVQDTNNNNHMRLGFFVRKTGQVNHGVEPDVLAAGGLTGTLRVNTLGRLSRRVQTFVYDIPRGSRGVILCEGRDFGGRSLHRTQEDTNINDDGIQPAWGHRGWVSSLLVLPSTSGYLFRLNRYGWLERLWWAPTGPQQNWQWRQLPSDWEDTARGVRPTLR
jgi:hypothetical protein